MASAPVPGRRPRQSADSMKPLRPCPRNCVNPAPLALQLNLKAEVRVWTLAPTTREAIGAKTRGTLSRFEPQQAVSRLVDFYRAVLEGASPIENETRVVAVSSR